MTEPAPPWRQIYDDLLRRIRSGELRPGAQMPSATELQAEYSHLSPSGHLSYGPPRRAVQKLRDEGYLTYWPGLGMYVARELPQR